jgi:hypothetical protein
MLDALKTFAMITLAFTICQLCADGIKAIAVMLWKRVVLWGWAVMMLKGGK